MNRKISIEYINKYLKDNNLEVELLSIEYVNNNAKLLWKCKCGNEYKCSWHQFKNAKQYECSECRRKNGQAYRKTVPKKIKDDFKKCGFTLCEEYKNSDSSLKVIDEDEYFHSFSYRNLLSNKSKRRKMRMSLKNPYWEENLKTFMSKNKDVELLDYFVKQDNVKHLYLHLKCHKCNYEWTVSMHAILANENTKIKCKGCSWKSKVKDTNDVYEDFLNNGFELLDNQKYIKNSIPMYCKEISTGYIGKLSLNNVQNNNKFSLYRNNDYWDYNLYIVLRSYNNRSIIVKEESDIKNRIVCLECNICHEKFTITLDALVRGDAGFMCGICSGKISSLEAKTMHWLDEHNLQYVKEKTFDECVYKIKLRFDFCIFVKDKILLIECDGEQHDKKSYMMDDKDFQELQIRDNIKNEYCKNNNIPLLRIKNQSFRSNKYKDILQNFINDNI